MAGVCYQFAQSGSCSYGNRCRFAHIRTQVIRPSQSTQGRLQRVAIEECSGHNNILRNFFARYPSFDYDAAASSSKEFYRMCDHFGWDREDEERAIAHNEFKNALVLQFNARYGTDASSIQTWVGLCKALAIKPLPTNVEEAKKILKGKFVNLVDLVDRRTSEQVTQFSNLEDLQEYTIATGKFFPKSSAYAGGMLKYLLPQPYVERVAYRSRTGPDPECISDNIHVKAMDRIKVLCAKAAKMDVAVKDFKVELACYRTIAASQN